MAIDDASLHESPSRPPDSSKQDVRDCGRSDDDSEETATPVPMHVPVATDQTDMSTDSKMSGLSHDSAGDGTVTTVPAGPHTLISTRRTQLDLEKCEPKIPWKPGSSSHKKFEQRFHDWHNSTCAEQESLPPPKGKLSVLYDCFSQFLCKTNTTTSVRIDRFFGCFESSSYHEALAFEELTAHWMPEPMNALSGSKVGVPPGNCASKEWKSMHAALSKHSFAREITTWAKAAVVDLFYWLLQQDSAMSLQPIRDWLAAPSWDTLHPLTGRYIVMSAQASNENATETEDVAARP